MYKAIQHIESVFFVLKSALTAIISAWSVIAVALSLGDLVAFLGVVERRVAGVVIPGWWWWRFGRAVHGKIASGAY